MSPFIQLIRTMIFYGRIHLHHLLVKKNAYAQKFYRQTRAVMLSPLYAKAFLIKTMGSERQISSREEIQMSVKDHIGKA